MPGPTQHLTLVADERRYDLVVPVGTRVTEVLAVLGISSSATPGSVATAAGHVYGPQDRIDEDLPAGTVLTVVRTTTHRLHRDIVSLDRSAAAPGARRPGPSWAGGSRAPAPTVDPRVSLVDDATRRRDTVDDADATVSRAALHGTRRRGARSRPHGRATRLDTAAPLLAGTAVLGLLAGTIALWAPLGDGDGLLASDPARWSAAALLVAAGVTATLLAPRHHAAAPLVRLVAAPALTAAGGLVVPLAASPARVGVSVVLAAALAAVVTALASTDGSPDRAERTATFCLGGLAVVVAATVLWGQPLVVAAAVLVGLAPVAVRALPSASLDVDPTQLLDTDRLSTTVWSVREVHQGRRRRVTDVDVRERVAQARSVVAAGTAYLGVFAAVGGWVLASSPARSELAPWSRWVVLLVAAVALGYQSRHVRDRLARFAMLGTAASLTVSASVAVVGWDDGWLWPVVAGALVLGGVAVLAALALAGGWASPRMSRVADRLESLAVVTALPLALAAAGAVETLRRLTSG